ncbi:MAG TPA: hypothetical protein VHS55_07450 [Solirubrobacteraceae bacterium]|jgi:hypothetical protein|nr:hypothetical protein [Solirubrobacteraceae bacterium]
MTKLTPSVFDFVEEYAAELDSLDDLPLELSEEGALIVFVREFFIQFCGEIYQFQILTFDDATAITVHALDSERNPEGSHADRIVAALREFCQNYATIISEQYDADANSTFQREFVPSLLEDIDTWAVADGGRDQIADAAKRALDIIKNALAKVGD